MTGGSRYWLFAFGPKASFSEATVIRAADANEATQRGVMVALRELERHPGTHHAEEILTLPKDTGLYAILLPEAKVMVDTHWESRDSICDHWEAVIRNGSRNPVKARQEEYAAQVAGHSPKTASSGTARVASYRVQFAGHDGTQYDEILPFTEAQANSMGTVIEPGGIVISAAFKLLAQWNQESKAQGIKREYSMATSIPGAVRSPNLQGSIDRSKAERANAAQKGLVILPSVEGPYVFDPVADKALGRSGSDEYRAAVSDQPPSMTKERFLELQSASEALDLNHAQGRILPGHYERVQQIADLMSASPWTLSHDHGCILKSELEEKNQADVQRA